MVGRWKREVAFIFGVGALLWAVAYMLGGPWKRLDREGHVNDFAGRLSEGSRARLESALGALKTKTGTDITIVTVESLEDHGVNEYARELFSEWELGGKASENGIMVLVAVDEERMKIRAGRALGKAVGLQTIREIEDSLMRPRFRTGNFDGGLAAGALALRDEVALNARHIQLRSETERAGNIALGLVVLCVVLPAAGFVIFVLAARSAKRRRAAAGGSGTGGTIGSDFGGFGGGGGDGGGGW